MVCGVNVNYGETGGQARRARRVKSYGHYAALSLGIGHGAEGIEHREIQWAAGRRQKKDIGSLVSGPWSVAN